MKMQSACILTASCCSMRNYGILWAAANPNNANWKLALVWRVLFQQRKWSKKKTLAPAEENLEDSKRDVGISPNICFLSWTHFRSESLPAGAATVLRASGTVHTGCVGVHRVQFC